MPVLYWPLMSKNVLPKGTHTLVMWLIRFFLCWSNLQFNKESYVDFVVVQIKFLSFLVYMVRIYQVSYVTIRYMEEDIVQKKQLSLN